MKDLDKQMKDMHDETLEVFATKHYGECFLSRFDADGKETVFAQMDEEQTRELRDLLNRALGE